MFTIIWTKNNPKHTYPSRNSKSFEYDNNDNISKITKEDETIISQSYDNLNRLKTVSANETTQQTFTYDALSRVISSKDTNSNTKYNTVTYTYDNKNNIRTSIQNGKTISEEYDSNSNLILMTLPNNKVVKNSYDTVNNLASVSLGNSQIVSFTYNQDNQLQTQTTSNGTTLTLGYDSVGRETKRSYKTSSNNVLFSSTLTSLVCTLLSGNAYTYIHK